jgi:hypothetical protein
MYDKYHYLRNVAKIPLTHETSTLSVDGPFFMGCKDRSASIKPVVEPISESIYASGALKSSVSTKLSRP